MKTIVCNPSNAMECWNCGKYWSSHSRHYNEVHGWNSQVNCDYIPEGYRVFKEKEEEIKEVKSDYNCPRDDIEPWEWYEDIE